MDWGNLEEVLADLDLDLDEIDLKEAELKRRNNLLFGHHRDHYDRINRECIVTPEHPEGAFEFMWKTLFRPIPKLYLAIKETMKDLGLRHGKYVSAHYRTSDNELDMVYKDSVREVSKTIDPDHDIENSIACAYKISPEKSYPVYFLSSNSANVRYAVADNELTKKNKNIKVIGNTNMLRLYSEKTFRGTASCIYWSVPYVA